MLTSAEEREFVTLTWHLLREANRKAAHASREYRAMDDAIEEWLDGMRITDPKQRADIKKENLELQAKYGAWNFWQQEARRLHDSLHGELIARQLLGLK